MKDLAGKNRRRIFQVVFLTVEWNFPISILVAIFCVCFGQEHSENTSAHRDYLYLCMMQFSILYGPIYILIRQ